MTAAEWVNRMFQALAAAHAGALEVRRDAPEVLGFLPPGEMAWDFWVTQVADEAGTLDALTLDQLARVRVHFLETWEKGV